ncbi:MAG: hypothetical protein K2L67_06370 [Clostridia bacterium]|nr:hypothetical protein [Clostridia bacterium]
MAYATPVLERNEVTEERKFNYAPCMTDEEHNMRIKKNYAMLINPEMRLDDVLGRSVEEVKAATPAEVAPAAPVIASAPAAPVIIEKPYRVENARADSPLFRADNPINRRILNVQKQVAEAQPSVEEEENEDLRPTPTTIQYKTTGVQNTVEEGKIANIGAEKRTSLNKKEKIIIAVVISVIVALFALIIINSAIISNLNNDLSSLQSSLTDVRGAYSGVDAQVSGFASNLLETVRGFAESNGMIK